MPHTLRNLCESFRCYHRRKIELEWPCQLTHRYYASFVVIAVEGDERILMGSVMEDFTSDSRMIRDSIEISSDDSVET